MKAENRQAVGDEITDIKADDDQVKKRIMEIFKEQTQLKKVVTDKRKVPMLKRDMIKLA